MTDKVRAEGGGGTNGADTEVLLAAFVGAHWESHYRHSFAALRANPSPLRGSWNWAAALAPFWLASRGLWLWQVFLPLGWFTSAGALTNAGLPLSVSAALVLVAVAAVKGYWADRWLLADARRVIRGAGALPAGDPRVLEHVARQGGLSRLSALVLPVVVGLPLWVFVNGYVATYSNYPFMTPEFGSAAAEAKGMLVAHLPLVQPEAGPAPFRAREAWVEQDFRVRTAYLFFRRIERRDRWFLALGGVGADLDSLMRDSRVEWRINGSETNHSCTPGLGCVLWIRAAPPFPDTARLSFCERPPRRAKSAPAPQLALPKCETDPPARQP